MNPQNQERKLMEDQFYAGPFSFSYSSLSKLLTSPKAFYKHYVLGQKEDLNTPSTIEGKLLHCLLLEPDEFTSNFVISLDNLPGDNVKDVIDKVYEIYKQEQFADEELTVRHDIADFDNEILEILKDKKLYQTFSDPVKLGKIINEAGRNYFQFLKRSNNKIIISSKTYADSLETVELIKNNEAARLMGLYNNEEDFKNIRKEITIGLSDETFPFGLKGIIDNVYIDYPNLTVRINDLKTTNRTLSEFPDTVEYYKYWIQAAIYMRLVTAALSEKHGTDWKYIFSFIVIDNAKQIYPFEVSEDTMTQWQIQLQDLLREAEYHYTSRDYTLPYKFVKSKVIL